MTKNRTALALLLVGSSLVVFAGCSGAADSSASGSAALSDDATTASSATAAQVRVHYPTGYGHAITLHCGGDAASWGTAIPATWTEGDIWTAAVAVPAGGGLSCKPMYDDKTWSLGPNYAVSAGATVEIWPHFFHANGTIQQITGWYSHVLDDSRDIWVYTPPSYTENPHASYPVVYMHDGQNLFYDSLSASGTSWDIGGAMDRGAADGSIPEAIVIGMDNDANRIPEYTPVADPDDGGGNADAYLAFVTTELKPQMDAQFHTMTDATHTAVMGSSLGGLVSLYAGLSKPDVFALVGALSPSTWWDNEWITTASQNATPAISRLYLDSGDSGQVDDDVGLTKNLAAVWQTKPNVHVDYLVQAGAIHSEVYWRQRVPGALSFLLSNLPGVPASTQAR